MEQIAKLFASLAAYSKMRDRELFREVRQFYCSYWLHNWQALQEDTSKSASVFDMRAGDGSLQTLADGPFSAMQ